MMSVTVEKLREIAVEDCDRRFESCTAQFLKICWKIPEYFSYSDAVTNGLDSPSFTFANATWCFRLCSNALEDETAVSLVRLHPLRSSSLPEIVYKFGIKLGNLGYYSVNKYEVLYHKKNIKDYKHFRFQSSLLVANQKTFAPDDDTLELMCHIFHENFRKTNAVFKNVSRKGENSEKGEEKDVQKTLGTISLKSGTAESIKVTWKIPNDFLFHVEAGDSLSTHFSFARANWLLRLYPNGKTIDDLQPKMSLARSHSLVPSLQEVIYTFEVRFGSLEFHSPHYSDLYFNEYRERVNSILGMPEGLRLIGDHNDVTMVCYFFCIESTEKDEVADTMSSELDNCKTVHQNLKNLFLNGQDHDLILKVNEKEFRVHRNILIVRSQVFASMLTHDMTEKNNGVVSVPDCLPEAMEKFLLYMYCDKVDALDENNALELYYLADKYNMMNLKEECRDFLKNSLSCSNFYDVVQLALTHSDKHLLEFTVDFSTKQNK